MSRVVRLEIVLAAMTAALLWVSVLQSSVMATPRLADPVPPAALRSPVAFAAPALMPALTSAAVGSGRVSSGDGQARPGTVQTLHLPSADAPGGMRSVWVYRPGVPDSADLPVVYFLHGLPGSYTDLAETGLGADLDAAFTSGRLAPFVVVSPDGNSTGASDPEWADSVDGRVGLESFVTGELITAVEGSYRRDPEHRAIVGFSMGGFGAMNLALRHPDIYGQVVSIAGYFRIDDPSHVFGSDPATLAANSPDQQIDVAALLRIMLTDGANDTEPVVEGETQRFAGLLRAAGQHPAVLITPGIHNWTYVASALPAVEQFLEAGWAAAS
jgi:S-formylglutathione hydrolase FrmB